MHAVVYNWYMCNCTTYVALGHRLVTVYKRVLIKIHSAQIRPHIHDTASKTTWPQFNVHRNVSAAC